MLPGLSSALYAGTPTIRRPIERNSLTAVVTVVTVNVIIAVIIINSHVHFSRSRRRRIVAVNGYCSPVCELLH